MKTVKLCLDFMNGPIWKDVYDVKKGILITGIECIDDDEEIQKINEAVQEKYNSFYIFSNDGVKCSFDEKAFKTSQKELLDLVEQLKLCLGKLNDGSFEVEDYITSGLISK